MTRPCFDDLAMADVYDNPPLREYLTGVQKWHGYIRLLGLPDLRDHPSVAIDSLFVPPLVSKRPISVDADFDEWRGGCESVYAALEEHGRLVLLGDPGMGKTTLVDYLTWLLTFSGRPSPLIKRFGWILPVPMMLRELALESVTTFDGLLQAFLSQPVGEPLREGDYLRDRLAEGRALVMLDGIDELGGQDARQCLRQAVFDGIKRYPGCLWLLTSRIVGYGEVPFDTDASNELPQRELASRIVGDGEAPIERTGPQRQGQSVVAREINAAGIHKRHVAPFDNVRIKAFVHKWYVLRHWDGAEAGKHDDLVAAIRKDAALQRLARVPNVLALMALIHRIDATLPQEKWLLYERIAEAYLVSIDRSRGLSDGAYDLPRKKMWLARVGFEMQTRREQSGDGEVLAQRDDALHWIGSEMERSKASIDAPTPEEFLSFVGRRSGLFVPKGDGLYAFRHLSFQEYFAAVALAIEVTGFSWAKDGRSSLGFNRTHLAGWARQRSWLDAFCFLFEMLADKPEWHRELAKCVFGGEFSNLPGLEPSHKAFGLAHLAAHLVVNPHSGLGQQERAEAIDWCVYVQIKYSNRCWRTDTYSPDPSLFSILMTEDRDLCATVMASIRKLWLRTTEGLDRKVLDLRGANILDLRQIAELSGLEVLILSDTDVADVRCLTVLNELEWLDLSGTAVTDITPIARLPRIEVLDISHTDVQDISSLADLHDMAGLFVAGTAVSFDAIEALEDALPNCVVVLGR